MIIKIAKAFCFLKIFFSFIFSPSSFREMLHSIEIAQKIYISIYRALYRYLENFYNVKKFFENHVAAMRRKLIA